MFSAMDSTHAHFYRLALTFCLAWMALFRLRTGHQLHVLTRQSVLTRPPWLSADVIVALSARRGLVFATLPAALGLAAFLPDVFIVRLIAAVTISLYHLCESSSTNRHGEYPLLYCAWAMLLPDELASVAAFGIAVHFILSCGVAKADVGGVAGWCHPSTMRTYLEIYGSSKSRSPLSRRLNRWVRERRWATAAIGVCTLGLECVLIPAALLAPPALRPLATWALVVMHVGIAVLMSVEVGFVFMTTITTYIVGFGCDAAAGSRPWLIAVGIGLLPTALSCATGRSLPEAWPCTSSALFMWNSSQAARIAAHFMTGDTRLVLATGREHNLVGLKVVHHGLAQEAADDESAGAPAVVHDAVLRILGFTLLHDVPGLRAPLEASAGAALDVRAVAWAVRGWLVRERRLIERRSGQPLLQAAFVRVGEDGRVVERLDMGQPGSHRTRG